MSSRVSIFTSMRSRSLRSSCHRLRRFLLLTAVYLLVSAVALLFPFSLFRTLVEHSFDLLFVSCSEGSSACTLGEYTPPSNACILFFRKVYERIFSASAMEAVQYRFLVKMRVSRVRFLISFYIKKYSVTGRLAS